MRALALALGFLTGSAMMVPATWDGASCPTGSASVTAYAVGQAMGDVQVVSGTFTLPGAVTLDLPNLYQQAYLVRAQTTYPDGRTFSSAEVPVTGTVPFPSPSPTPTPTPPPQGQVATVVLVVPTGNPVNSIYENQTAQAVAKDSAGTILTTGFTWQSEHPEYLTIDATTGAITKVTMGTLDPSRLSIDVFVRAIVNGAIASSIKAVVLRGNAPTTPPPPTGNTIDSVAAQITAVDAKITTLASSVAAHDQRLQSFASSVNISFATLTNAVNAPKDLTQTALTLIEQGVQRQLQLFLTPPQIPTASCTWTTVNNTSVYCRARRVDFPNVVTGGTGQIVK